MAKVRPLSMREILKAVRKRGVPDPARGGTYRHLYFITEIELKALASAFYRASRRRLGGTAK